MCPQSVYHCQNGHRIPSDKWGYKLQNFPVAALPAPDPIAIYSMKRIALMNLHICNIIFPIIDQCRYFFTSVIRFSSSNVLWFWATKIPKPGSKQVYGSLYSWNVFSPIQGDEGFCLCRCLIQKCLK